MTELPKLALALFRAMRCKYGEPIPSI